jgi:WhiB family transcriptional regulator, redox-sensing transcriptional regulator
VSELGGLRRNWMSDSACRRADPELFFPSADRIAANRQAFEAKAVCARCPVRTPCLRYALATRQKHGVWGGATEDERRSMTRRNGRGRPGLSHGGGDGRRLGH